MHESGSGQLESPRLVLKVGGLPDKLKSLHFEQKKS